MIYLNKYYYYKYYMNSNINNEHREKYVLLIDKILDNISISREIEKSIYNETIKYSKKNNIKRKWSNNHFKLLYISKIRSIYTNINTECYLKNMNFKDKILNNEINPSKIGELSNYDMFPENWKDLIEENIKKDKLKYELKPQAMTDLFKCRRCGGRSCSSYEVQTRSADEPMTQFITCLDCNNHWKQ